MVDLVQHYDLTAIPEKIDTIDDNDSIEVFHTYIMSQFPDYAKGHDEFCTMKYIHQPLNILVYKSTDPLNSGHPNQRFIDIITADIWPLFNGSVEDPDGVKKRSMFKYLALTIMCALDNYDQTISEVNWGIVNLALNTSGIKDDMKIRAVQYRKLFDYFRWVSTINNIQYITSEDMLAKILISRLFNIFDYMQLHYIYMVTHLIRGEYNWGLGNYFHIYVESTLTEEKQHNNYYVPTDQSSTQIIQMLNKIEANHPLKITQESQFILERVCDDQDNPISNMEQLIDIIHYLCVPYDSIKETMTSIILIIDY